MKKYDTIKELYEAVHRGEIDESKLEITLDNDCTSFTCGPTYDEETDEETDKD